MKEMEADRYKQGWNDAIDSVIKEIINCAKPGDYCETPLMIIGLNNMKKE